MSTGTTDTSHGNGILDLIEWVGNKLPDPTTLFLIGAILVMIISHVAVSQDWSVQEEKPIGMTQEVTLEDGSIVMEPVIDEETGEQVLEWQLQDKVHSAKSLLSRDGIYWAIKNMVTNFTGFEPLGIVLVGMLGIGIAERTGLIAAILKWLLLFIPEWFLTPTMVFTGIMSSMTLDAGYVVLPPLAAALYKAVGRSPLVGIAAVFAGVAAGFNANLFITGLDPLLANLSTIGAQAIDPNYQVHPACNLWFMIASTFVMTFVGWGVTTWFVERRMNKKPADLGGPSASTTADLESQRLQPIEKRGLIISGFIFAFVFGIILAVVLIPSAPLYTYHTPIEIEGYVEGVPAELNTTPPSEFAIESLEPVFTDANDTELVPSKEHFDRWVDSIVPILFLSFLIPAIAYGVVLKKVRNDKDIAKLLMESIAAMAPIIVLAFFAAQFIEYFQYSGLDSMLATSGGLALGKAGFSPYTLMIAFILVVLFFNLFVGSMSAKYAMFAPIFIPMFMMTGISPELTQVAYRIGDSTSNIITPLNPYLIIILVFMQKYSKKSGMGTLIAMMMPYTVIFTIVWIIMLMVWMWIGFPLGRSGELFYVQ